MSLRSDVLERRSLVEHVALTCSAKAALSEQVSCSVKPVAAATWLLKGLVVVTSKCREHASRRRKPR